MVPIKRLTTDEVLKMPFSGGGNPLSNLLAEK